VDIYKSSALEKFLNDETKSLRPPQTQPSLTAEAQQKQQEQQEQQEPQELLCPLLNLPQEQQEPPELPLPLLSLPLYTQKSIC
jgi:hypothetical protein